MECTGAGRACWVWGTLTPPPGISRHQQTRLNLPDTFKHQHPPQTYWRSRVSGVLWCMIYWLECIIRYGKSGSGPEQEFPSPEDQHIWQVGRQHKRNDSSSEDSLYTRNAQHCHTNNPASRQVQHRRGRRWRWSCREQQVVVCFLRRRHQWGVRLPLPASTTAWLSRTKQR